MTTGLRAENFTYYCLECSDPTDTLHEIFQGADRQHCIKWLIQVPLCIPCHDKYHYRDDKQLKRIKKEKWLKWLGLEPDFKLSGDVVTGLGQRRKIIMGREI